MIVTADGQVEITGVGYDPEGRFRIKGGDGTNPAADRVIRDLTLAAVLCNDTALRCRDGDWTVEGDPMEGALVSLAGKAGWNADADRSRIPAPGRNPIRFTAPLHGSPSCSKRGAAPLLREGRARASALMVAGAFGIYAWAMARGLPIETARIIVVNAPVVMEMFYLFSVRYAWLLLHLEGCARHSGCSRRHRHRVRGAARFHLPASPAGGFGSRPVSFGEGMVIIAVGVALLVIVEVEKRLASHLGFRRA